MPSRWIPLHIKVYFLYNTGRFLMFSVITNIYNKKTKGSILMELFTATDKLNFFLTTRYVDHEWHSTHRYDIQILASHASTWVHRYSALLQWSVPLGTDHWTHVDACEARTWISYRCVPCHRWCIYRTSVVVIFFSFPVAVNNSIKVGPLIFWFYIYICVCM
jgi:hypothetical protein